MWRMFFCIFLAFVVQFVSGNQLYHEDRLCGNITERARACATQILGHPHTDIDSCTIEIPHPGNSAECNTMDFSPFDYHKTDIGGVRLQPYIWLDSTTKYSVNRTVLNITFTNIKWKTMKFRFQLAKKNLPRNLVRNHCRNIVLSNDLPINDQSVLYYDCYWSVSDGKSSGLSHILDFESSDDKNVNRGQYYFNVPSAEMLSPSVTEEEWLPFLYIEILNDKMRLHVNPPPKQLNITGYEIKVMKEGDKGTFVEKVSILKLKNATEEVTYDYSLLYNGSYHFVVTPLHEKCQVSSDENEQCRSLKSPNIVITSDVRTLDICIVSVTAVIVAAIFVYYLILRVIRRSWCKEYTDVPKEMPPPTKVLVIYSPANRLHAGCVASFVTYLRSEYGFDVMYDGDICATSHNDPYIWAEEAFKLASHVIYIVGPADNTNTYSIYDKPIINAHRNVDKLLLAQLRADRVSKSHKQVLNVFFEHSNGSVPIETKHAKAIVLLKDWQKLIAILSMNLLPKKQIMRTEEGKVFLEDLAKTKKLLSEHNDKMLV